MLNARKDYGDAPTLAAAVRQIAREARPVLRGEADDRAAEILIGRIDRVLGSDAARGHGPIAHWLESLRREVEAATLPVAPA